MELRITPARAAALLGFGVAFIGSFLPWISAGLIHANGTEGDGVITLIGAAGGVLLVLFSLDILAVLAAVLLGALTGYEIIHISQKVSDYNDSQQILHANIGSGLILLGIGAVIAFFATLSLGPTHSKPSARLACSECGTEVFKTDKACPNCGADFSSKRYYRRAEIR